MATKTKNLNLIKPDGSDSIKVTDINRNMDAIDEAYEELGGKANSAVEQSALNYSTLGFQRKNLLKNSAAAKTQNGITFTINDDMSLTVNGTATGIAASTIAANFIFESGKSYIISGCPTGGSDSTYRIDIGNTTDGYNVYDYGSEAVFTPSETKSYAVRIRIASGAVIDNLTFYPMIRDARIADDSYVPYAPSVQEQITAILARIESLETAAATEV